MVLPCGIFRFRLFYRFFICRIGGIIMLDNLFTSLDKFYQERPWYFRIMFFALGYMITDLANRALRK